MGKIARVVGRAWKLVKTGDLAHSLLGHVGLLGTVGSMLTGFGLAAFGIAASIHPFYGIPAVLFAIALAMFILARRQVLRARSEPDEYSRLVREERAKLEAADQVRRERAAQVLFGTIGETVGDTLEKIRADQKAEDEAKRLRLIREASQPLPAPKFNMRLKAVLERIAFQSQWSATRDFSSPKDHWQQTMWGVPLGKELLHPLASGDIPSRGIRSGEDGDEHGLSDIPSEFWRNPKLKPHADRLLLEDGYDYVGEFGVPPTYHDIRLRSVDVERIWPVRKLEEIEADPSPFAAWAEEWKAAYEERLINSQMEIEENLARLMHKARRRLIAKGRDVVERFRAERPSEPFETWARHQRGYLDVQPHLGGEYQKWVTRNAERDVSAIADGEFLRELARLEKEWRLI